MLGQEIGQVTVSGLIFVNEALLKDWIEAAHATAEFLQDVDGLLAQHDRKVGLFPRSPINHHFGEDRRFKLAYLHLPGYRQGLFESDGGDVVSAQKNANVACRLQHSRLVVAILLLARNR